MSPSDNNNNTSRVFARHCRKVIFMRHQYTDIDIRADRKDIVIPVTSRNLLRVSGFPSIIVIIIIIINIIIVIIIITTIITIIHNNNDDDNNNNNNNNNNKYNNNNNNNM